MTEINRRGFIAASAVAGTAMALDARSYAKVAGANGKQNIAFLGVGGRCQQHVDVILKMKAEGKGVEPFAVCDVWDGQVVKDLIKGRGLFPTAERCGLDATDKTRVNKDYREILKNKDVDIVAIATPDHWHARMTIDAMNAGKDVYCEKPMTKTVNEAWEVVNTWKKTGKIMSVGVQSMADPTWRAAHEYIAAGNIGHVMQGQTSYYRNSDVGQWRYYPLTKEMTPKTVNWDMWLGHEFECAGEKLGPAPKDMPFDRAVWAQWRCYWPFGGGMFTDLFVHQTTHLLAAMGLREPARVVGGGGIFFEYDGRGVPDTATVVADYNEGAQVLISATMCNATQLGEVIRGKTATIRFKDNIGGDYVGGFEVFGESVTGGPAKPVGGAPNAPVHVFKSPKEGVKGLNGTYDLWANFLECVRARNQDTLSTPYLGASAFTTVNLGVQSYRQGKAFFFDKETHKAKEADASWATRWERRSTERGKPNNVIGWNGGDKGQTLHPPAYQKLEGPWVDGKDPAGA